MKKCFILLCFSFIACGNLEKVSKVFEDDLKEYGESVIAKPEYMTKHFRILSYKNNTSRPLLLTAYYVSVLIASEAKEEGMTYVSENPPSCSGDLCMVGYYILDDEHLSYFPEAYPVSALLSDLSKDQIALIIVELETGEDKKQIQQQIITYIEQHIQECEQNYKQCIKNIKGI